MNNIEKIEWEPKFSVDIKEIDELQKKMFQLFNQLIEMREEKEEPKAIINMVTEINELSKLYFTTEERFLKRKKYPDHSNHAKAHRQFIKSALSLRREIASDISSLTDEVIMELRDWLIIHILTQDSLYVPFLRINKYIEESKK